jgi:DNA (cytosine-5)-methyltransferase 1
MLAMTYRPMALDLFCGEGGAAKGYDRAGFGVVGVDLNRKVRKRYPFPFIQDDVLNFLRWMLAGNSDESFDLIHASPPCQLYTKAQFSLVNKPKHPDLIGPVREGLLATGKQYVIENVPGAPLIDPIELCGCMFDMTVDYKGQRFALYRPRLFETNFPVDQPAHSEHKYPAMPVFGHSMPGNFIRKWGWNVPSSVRNQLMGTEWMTRNACSEAIPPVFTEYIANEFLAYQRGDLAA